ncbi:MAG TPA: FtsX-like permease family protein [Candidatus Hypogeohydataceae bacterium YC41]
MYKFFIALRYLKKKKSSYIAVAAVALSVMTYIIVISVMSGFDRELRTRIRGTLAHVVIMKIGGLYAFDNYKEVMEVVKGVEHVKACAPFVEGPALARVRGNREFAYFRGIDPVQEAKVGDFASYIGKFGKKPEDLLKVHGETNAPSIFGGTELLRLAPGDTVKNPESFIPAGEKITLVTVKGWDKISVKAFVIEGMFQSGMYDFDKTSVYIPLEAAQELVGASNAVTGISLQLDDYRHGPQVRENLQKQLGPGYFVQTWEDLRKTFLRAVTLERRVMAVILFFFLLVAAFCIMAILRMIVFIVAKDIGILKALGATQTGISSIFLFKGFSIGFIGAAIGVGFGLLIVAQVNWFEGQLYHITGWRPFPPEVYYFEKIPTEVNPWSIAIIAGVAIFLSTLASVYPAVKAARLDPVEILRYE